MSCFASISLAQVATPSNNAVESPIRSKAKPIDKLLSMDVEINSITRMLMLKEREGHIFATKSDLKEFGIECAGEEMALDEIDKNLVVDRRELKIKINAQANSFVSQSVSFRDSKEVPVLDSNFGAWINYDTRVANLGKETGFQTLLDVAASTKWGILQSQHVFNSLGTTGEDKFRRIATVLRKDNPEDLSSTDIGDTFSMPGYWGSPVRFGGLRMSSNYTLNPKFITTPRYDLEGRALTPSYIEIFEGDRKTYSGKVNAGPFSITDYVPLTTTGDARIVVRDAFGQEQVISHAVYSTPQQLGHGINAYSLELGMLRTSETYGAPYFGAGLRRGFDLNRVPLLNWAGGIVPSATLEGRMEGTTGDMRIGVGIAFSSWLGNVSMAGALGQAGSKSAQKNGMTNLPDTQLESSSGTPSTPTGNTSNQFDFSGQPTYIKQKVERPSLFSIGWDRQIYLGSLGQVNAFGNASIPTNWTPIGGAAPLSKMTMFGMSYHVPKYDLSISYTGTIAGSKANQNTSHSFGVSKKMDGGVSVGLSATKTDTDMIGMLTVSWNMNRNGSAHAALSKDSSNLSYSGSTDDNSNRWNLGVGKTQTDTRFDGSVSSDWSYAKSEVLVSSVGGQQGFRAGLRGSVAYAGGEVWMARPITQGVVIADLKESNIDVTANNRPVGKTNQSGRVLIPDLASWKENTVAVDADALPRGYTTSNESSFRFRPRFGGVHEVSLGIKQPGYIAKILVNGVPLQSGAQILIADKPFVHSAAIGAYVIGVGAGKQRIEVGGCKREITVPDLKPEIINRFEFELNCKQEEIEA